jgi:hypothetical protein
MEMAHGRRTREPMAGCRKPAVCRPGAPAVVVLTGRDEVVDPEGCQTDDRATYEL